LENATGLKIEDKIFETLGFCSETETIGPGLLAEATTIDWCYINLSSFLTIYLTGAMID
jgi:hypothetical protein